MGSLQLAANSTPQSTKETQRVIFINEGQDAVRSRVQAVKAIAQSKASAIVKTRLKLSCLSVTCFLRHPIRQCLFSLFLEAIGICQNLEARAGAAMLTCCLTRSQHQVESSCSYRVVVLSSSLVDCCLPLSYHVFCSPCSRSFSAFVFSN